MVSENMGVLESGKMPAESAQTTGKVGERRRPTGSVPGSASNRGPQSAQILLAGRADTSVTDASCASGDLASVVRREVDCGLASDGLASPSAVPPGAIVGQITPPSFPRPGSRGRPPLRAGDGRTGQGRGMTCGLLSSPSSPGLTTVQLHLCTMKYSGSPVPKGDHFMGPAGGAGGQIMKTVPAYLPKSGFRG